MKKIEASLIKRLRGISTQIWSLLAFIIVNFCQFILYHPHSILSLSHTLGHLDFSWSTLGGAWHTQDLEQERKEKVGKDKRKMRSVTAIGFSCMYQVACMISLLVLACMWFLCYDLSLALRIVWIDSGFA